jgi:DMSO/TMAO reductase YedYZ molybdopterin-dependent catalytic subunit
MVRQARRALSRGAAALRHVWLPPERLRVGPFREGAFRSHLHHERVGAWLGIALGVAFGACFLTGVLSHLIQHPPSWLQWPPRPAGLYRVTQGVHVATGIASIPLLLAKVWAVYPRLWRWPPFRSPAHLLERVSLVPLVAGSVFLLVSGVINITTWYPWSFFFPSAHFWTAWITVGAMVVHIGAKASVTRRALMVREPEPLSGEGGLSRRAFLGAAGVAVGTLAVTTVGQTVTPLRSLAALAPRRPDVGPQGFPVNKTARGARVVGRATDPGYRLRVEGAVRAPLALSLDDLRRMPTSEATLPIACVDGWSANERWRGVPLRQLLELAGAAPGAEVLVESLQPTGLYRTSIVNSAQAADHATLLALEVNGEPLHIDHGFPVRLIGPNRPGVMQTKWVGRLLVR